MARNAQDPKVVLVVVTPPHRMFPPGRLDVIDLHVSLDEELLTQLATEPGRPALQPSFCLSPTVVRCELRRTFPAAPAALTSPKFFCAPFATSVFHRDETATHNHASTSISIGPSGTVH